MFATRPECYVRPSGGATHVLRVVREMLWAHPETSGTDIGAALEYLTGVQRRRATVFLVSDFLAEIDARQLRAAVRRHDIIAIRVREPIDEALPDAGIVTIRDSESGRPTELDTGSRAVRAGYAAHVEEMDRERRLTFGAIGVDEIPAMVGVDYVPALLRFFRRRTVGAA